MKTLSASAIISKITSTVDGGWSVTINISEDERNIIKELIDWKANAELVAVVFQEID